MRLADHAVAAGFAISASMLVLFACGATVTARPPASAEPAVRVSVLEQATVDAVNQARSEAGLGALSLSADLTRIARAHSAFQARTGRSGHSGQDGATVADRARDGGVAYHSLAENVAMNYGYPDPVATAVREWMKSAPHRHNIMNADFTQTGVGVASDENGKHYFTQMFLEPPTPR